MNRLVRLLPAVTLVAVLVVTATSEFRLAVDVLALPVWVAWGVPAAIDSYVVAAVRSRRDVLPAMVVMAMSLFAAAGSHLVAVRTGGRLPVEITGPVSAVVLSVLVLVAWRVHVLIDRLAEPVLPSGRLGHGLAQSPQDRLEPEAGDERVEQPRAVAAAPAQHLVRAAVPPATPSPGHATRAAVRALLTAEPDLSHRAAAKRLGIAPSTVGRALRHRATDVHHPEEQA